MAPAAILMGCSFGLITISRSPTVGIPTKWSRCGPLSAVRTAWPSCKVSTARGPEGVLIEVPATKQGMSELTRMETLLLRIEFCVSLVLKGGTEPMKARK
jgi:hypothetical protein